MKLTLDSRNPATLEDLIAGTTVPGVALEAELLLPAGTGRPPPVVIVAPGSGGLSASHRLHAEALIAAGIAAFIVDPFSGRGVGETFTDQKRLSFAASTYDVLAAAKVLRSMEAVDGTRIGAVGYSRGGTAVLLAASTQVARAVLGSGHALKAVYGAWPWGGYQFERALTAPTAVRFAVAELDNWVAPVQCQAWANAMRATNPKVSLRIFPRAHHGFGYREPVVELPTAIKAFNAPIVYINDAGTFIDWHSGEAMPGVDDAYWEKAAAPWLARGVTVGGLPGQYEAFVTDMVSFFAAELGPPNR